MARILFFTPVLPCIGGTGTAMRAGIALEALAAEHDVVVVHVDMWMRHRVMDDSLIHAFATEYHRLASPVTPSMAGSLAEKLSQVPADFVYVFRLAAAPAALQVVGMMAHKPVLRALDLDDDEATRPERFIHLFELAGNHARAQHERTQLGRLNRFQEIVLTRFEVSLLAAQEDRDSVAARFPNKEFIVLPNVARIPPERRFEPSERDGLLFLGTLDYVPNDDAAQYFCDEILPLVQRSHPTVALRIVGTNAPQSVIELGRRAGVTVVGAVKEVAPEFQRSRVLVVPLRAGSGTRIKILEAFSFGTPVVSSSIGAAGLDVEDGVQLLIADTPEEFAAACDRLLTDDQLAVRLATSAYAWLRETHSLDQARDVLHALFAENRA